MEASIPTETDLRRLMSRPRALGLFGVAILTGLTLSGCQSSRGMGGVDIDTSAGSQVNIASLTAVVQQNPYDASAYNVRGTAYGKAGDLKAADRRLRQGHQAQSVVLSGLRQPRARPAPA